MWVDVGANLTSESFRSDLSEVLDRARAAGVEACVVTGSSMADSRAAADLAASEVGLWSTAGVHPHEARHYDARTEAGLRELLARPEVVAVGECGLDFNRNFSPPEDQERAFTAQLELAVDLQRPVFLHERDAHERFVAILARFRPRLPRALIHCFTGTSAELDRYLELDLHVGITGWICDERRGLHLRDIVGRVPADRLMVETDCPYLLPRDLRPRPRSRRNEPSYLPHIAGAVAEVRGVSVGEIESSTERAARAFFGLPDAAPPTEG